MAVDDFLASPITFTPCSFKAELMVDNSNASSMTIKTRSLTSQIYAVFK